jgi:serine protease AprX
MKKFTLTLLIAFGALAASAQYTRHIVQFRDKKGTQGAIVNPATYLSAKAIERRTRQGIGIDSTDLPVSKAYLDSIAAVPNVTILNSSKWLNQVLIRTSDANALTKISSFPFVKSNTPIATRIATGSKAKIIEDEEGVPVTLPVTGRQQSVEGVQLEYGGTGNQIRIHKGEFLHNLGFTGQTMTIAVLDAGFFAYKTNPALDSVRMQGRVLGEWDWVAGNSSVNEDNAHGSNCFSIIAANRPGVIVGSAPHSKFWLFRTEDVASEFPVEEQNWVAAAEFADSAGVDMISSSLGYSIMDNPALSNTYPRRDGNTAISTIGADLAAKKGIIVMNSAGNSGNEPTENRYVMCPADGDSVVAVGATDANGNISGFSSWGPNSAGKLKPNIVSVGQGTVFAASNGNAVAGNGTSYSNPNIAGLIACFWQAFPELTNMQLIDAVQRSAHRYNNPDMRYGYGLPDFKKAFAAVLKQRATFSITANANCQVLIKWESKDNSGMQYKVQRKLSSDTGFITISSFAPSWALFQKSYHEYIDVVQGYTGNVQYRVQQVIGTDTTIEIGAGALNIVTNCTNPAFPIFTIRPNPVRNGMLQLHVSSAQAFPNLEIVISNMQGQVIRKVRRTIGMGTTTLQVPLNHVAAGMYAIRVFTGDQELYSDKIIHYNN